MVSLRIGDDDRISRFLTELENQNRPAFKQLKTAMRIVSEDRHYQNEYKFKNLSGGLYEIKTNLGVRVYAFLDDHENSLQQLVIASSGGGKGKSQSSDIAEARAIRLRYLQLREKQHVVPTLNLLPDENKDRKAN